MLESIIQFYHYIESLYFYEFVHRFLQILRLFNKNSRKSAENILNNQRLQKLIIEQDYLFSMIRSIFVFPTSSLKTNYFTVEFCLHFLSSLSNKHNSRNVSTQKYDFERRLCAQTQDLQIFKKFYMSQMNPKEFFRNTAHSV